MAQTKYFSGDEARIFIDGQFADSLVTLDYSAQQQKMPIYGYKSREWDAMAVGKFMIQGSFTVAFKEVGYILRLLRVNESTFSAGITQGTTLQLDDAFDVAEFRTVDEQLANLKESNPDHFDAVMDKLKRRVWGERVHFDTMSRLRTDLHDDPGQGSFLASPTFDMLVRYGSSSFVEVFEETRILNVSKILQPNGDPVLEMYEWIAKDMNQGLRYEIDEGASRLMGTSLPPACENAIEEGEEEPVEIPAAPLDMEPDNQPDPSFTLVDPFFQLQAPTSSPAAAAQADSLRNTYWPAKGCAPTVQEVPIMWFMLNMERQGHGGDITREHIAAPESELMLHAVLQSRKDYGVDPNNLTRGTYLDRNAPVTTFLSNQTKGWRMIENTIRNGRDGVWYVWLDVKTTDGALHGKVISYKFDSNPTTMMGLAAPPPGMEYFAYWTPEGPRGESAR